MQIGIPRETRPGETRVAATPETVKKLSASGKHTLVVEAGAGTSAAIPDDAYAAAGATIGSAADALGADIVLKVRGPSADEIRQAALFDPIGGGVVGAFTGRGPGTGVLPQGHC